MTDIFLIIGIFLFSGIFSFFFPRQVLLFTAASFPFYFFRFSVGGADGVGGVPFYFSEILIAGQFFSEFLKYAYKRVSFRTAPVSEKIILKNTFWNSLFPPFILLFSGLALSFFATPLEFRMQALGILKSWFIFPLLFFFLFSRIIPGLRSVRITLDFYSFSAVFLAGWGIWQWVMGAYLTVDMRASGPFESANYLALFLAPAAVYLLLRTVHLFFGDFYVRRFFFFRDFSYQRFFLFLFYALSTASVFFALYQTKSFGAFLGVMGGFLSYALIRRISWKRFFSLIFLVFFLGTVFFVTGDRQKFDALFRFSERSSSAVRLEIWEVSRQFISEHPVAGIGIGRFQDFYEQRASEILGHPPYEPSILHPHNLFLMFWLSSGLLGLAGFLWFLVLFFVWFFSAIPEHRRRIAALLFAMMIVILVHGLVDLPFWKNDLSYLFWLIFAGMERLRRS